MDGGRRNAPPSFLGLCEDKRPEDVVREKEAARKRRASVQFSRSKFRFSTMRAPLLVIDGDSFAHRAYHALPKTIRRRGGKGSLGILLLFSVSASVTRQTMGGWAGFAIDSRYRFEINCLGATVGCSTRNYCPA
jgi:hypothetical protein